MTQKKLKTFAEKLNAFMRMRESSAVYIERDYAHRFEYLPQAEVHDLFVLCNRIEATACELAEQVQRGAMDRETFRSQLAKRHPELQAERVARLISRSLYRTWA